MKKINVLPTTLFEFRLPDVLFKQTQSNMEKIDWSTIGNRSNTIYYGSSTSGYRQLNKEQDYEKLNKYVTQKLNIVSRLVGYTHMEKLKICLMWANKSTKQQWHHTHTHPWSILSGIIYVKGTSGRTWFSRKSEYTLPTEFRLSEDQSETELIYKHSPKPGTMLIFPSSLTHSVDDNEELERITIAFNSFPEGKVGDIYGLAGLKLKVN
jgi:uncharacterized protein (TIGR02466 family)